MKPSQMEEECFAPWRKGASHHWSQCVFFAGFELDLMHRSDKGPKFGAPLFGVSSPFGDAGSRIRDLVGRASPHLDFGFRFRI